MTLSSRNLYDGTRHIHKMVDIQLTPGTVPQSTLLVTLENHWLRHGDSVMSLQIHRSMDTYIDRAIFLTRTPKPWISAETLYLFQDKYGNKAQFSGCHIGLPMFSDISIQPVKLMFRFQEMWYLYLIRSWLMQTYDITEQFYVRVLRFMLGRFPQVINKLWYHKTRPSTHIL